MDELLVLYHGSQKIIGKPEFGKGRKNNDYGYGFYCTENKELSKEWAVSMMSNGYSNEYILETEYLNILNLNSEKYSILNWIAVLVEHRLFTINNPVVNRAKKYLIDNFGINVNAYDVIVGYRADDSYFDFAQSFLNNAITVEQLAYAMQLGKLGEQVVIKSQFAFSNLHFTCYETAEKDIYFVRRNARDEQANQEYNKLLESMSDGLYIQDIIRGGIKNDDSRIPRCVFK